ncbi:bis(5'-nucleosyl)-tetraphosphatase (symmetrical) YqeK [Fervidobacterium sp.]
MYRNAQFIVEDLEKLVHSLVTPDRIEHVNGVVDFCLRLAKRYSLDKDKLKIMALSHDLFRDLEPRRLRKLAVGYGIEISDLLEKKPILLHGFIAAEFLKKKYGIEDEDVLLGVGYHTSGHPSFGTYSKALALADSLELSRIYERVNQLRELAFYDIDIAFVEVIRNKICYAVNNNLYLLPQTISTWNKLMEGARV